MFAKQIASIKRHHSTHKCFQDIIDKVTDTFDDEFCQDIVNYKKATASLNKCDNKFRSQIDKPIAEIVDRQFKLFHASPKMQTVYNLYGSLSLFQIRYHTAKDLQTDSAFVLLYDDVKLYNTHDPMTVNIRNCKAKILEQLRKAKDNADIGLRSI